MILRNLGRHQSEEEEVIRGCLFFLSVDDCTSTYIHALLYEPARWASNSIQFGPIAA